MSLNLAHFESNLKRILTGERLVLYADLNTPQLNDYFRNLLLLLPLSTRSLLNWSEFIFHSLPEMDVSIVHSSRYSAPDGDIIDFQSDGESGIGETRCLPKLPMSTSRIFRLQSSPKTLTKSRNCFFP